MVVRRAARDEVSFLAEDLTGTACASALRKVRSLADVAPAGRAFTAIATLTEVAHRIENALEASSEAFTLKDEDTGSLELARSVVLMNRMTAEANSDKAEKPGDAALSPTPKGVF